MLVIPAIDIKGGRCVRLKQGRMAKETVYSLIPEEMAVRWCQEGAERLHIVDLDGAIRGEPINKEVIRNIAKAVSIPIQLGGGIRNKKTIEAYLDVGVSEIIFGTIAHKDPEFVKLACKEFPKRIMLAIDAKKDKVSVEGWTEETSLSPLEMARRYESAGIAAIIYTDIHRDGMETGPNIEATKAFARAIDVPVIASGGISDLDDVKNLLPLS
ncbi:MAG: 1-(5-phosphoribosyl)-5-[(5-phosphoribosylamino)methylideneamino]imidazole-4-carboxamide isomerase, partial [Pseudomonadota bacterium]